MTTVTKVDYGALKKAGVMQQVQKDLFSLRLRAVGGRVTAGQLETIKEVADKYGRGYVHLTSRQGIEIPFIHLDDIETVRAELSKGGVLLGASGPRVRTITACQGAAVCQHGLIDTDELAGELDARFGGRELPHKFKFGITGCRNNCLKAEENDLGIKGAFQPEWSEATCTYCGLCAAVCPGGAIKVDKAARELAFSQDDCVHCGRCAHSCPAAAWTGKSGYLIAFGGLFGNRIVAGEHLLPIIFDKEELFPLVEKTLAFFGRHAKPKERFRTTVERVGWDLLKKELLAGQ